MSKEKIEQIQKDIAAYKQAIEDAEGALEEAERELEEILAESYGSVTIIPVKGLAKGEVSGRIGLSVSVTVDGSPVTVQRLELVDDDLPPF